MSLHTIVFSLGCGIAWFLLLPVLAVGGGLLLLSYAVFAELQHYALQAATRRDHAARSAESLDVREIARRVCLGENARA